MLSRRWAIVHYQYAPRAQVNRAKYLRKKQQSGVGLSRAPSSSAMSRPGRRAREASRPLMVMLAAAARMPDLPAMRRRAREAGQMPIVGHNPAPPAGWRRGPFPALRPSCATYHGWGRRPPSTPGAECCLLFDARQPVQSGAAPPPGSGAIYFSLPVGFSDGARTRRCRAGRSRAGRAMPALVPDPARR
jgi:hypothetical protein